MLKAGFFVGYAQMKYYVW